MIIRKLALAIALAVLILAIAAGLRYAESRGLLAPDDASRTMQILIGLGLAAYANFMPKQRGKAGASPRAASWSQATLRVGGWSMMLAGLAYAGLWAFAPLPFADTASMIVVGAALVVTLGHAVWAYAACRRAGKASTGA